MSVTFSVDEGGGAFLKVRFVLRRYMEVAALGPGTERFLVFETSTEMPEGSHLPGRGDGVTITFDVPPDAGTTSLFRRDPAYWELLVEGDTTAGLYRKTFLLPLYARPVAGPSSAPEAAHRGAVSA